MPEELRGIGVGPGLAAGPLARMSPPPALPDVRAVTDPGQEAGVALRALEETAGRLRDRASAASGAARDILDAQVGCAGALGIEDGTTVTVDGTIGVVRAGVAAAEADAVRERASAERARAGRVSGPGRTSDGHRIDLMVNIGSAADLRGADPADLDGVAGVGLFRTEFLFLDRHDAPGLEEQVTAYTEAFGFFGEGRTVVVRTLDAGADKPLPFLGLPGEPNPALGVRGLRVARDRPEVLETQLEAIAMAAERTAADVWVMAPMVSTSPEAADFAGRVRAHGLDMAGVMIEVPAAALRAGRFLSVVDFLSIGTNDLSQYTLAADRQTGALADLLDPWQPALLELIGVCASAGRAAGKPVGICGEAAADPLLAPVLAGLGVTKLSMSPRSLPAVRAALAGHTLAECEELAAVALDTGDGAEARAAVIEERSGL